MADFSSPKYDLHFTRRTGVSKTIHDTASVAVGVAGSFASCAAIVTVANIDQPDLKTLFAAYAFSALTMATALKIKKDIDWARPYIDTSVSNVWHNMTRLEKVDRRLVASGLVAGLIAPLGGIALKAFI